MQLSNYNKEVPFKEFNVEGIGPVTIYKRRGSRSLRLTVQPDGGLRVTMPSWAPYASGVQFVRSRSDWIALQQVKRPSSKLRSGQQIGTAHTLLFTTKPTAGITTRVTRGLVTIRLPMGMVPSDDKAQTAARSAAIRALRQEAEDLLPNRLAMLAATHGFSYRSVNVKQLKSRWGSCDQAKNITLNLFLMQVPWDLIDYVLLHELVHTRQLHHGPEFWSEMDAVLPNAKRYRKAIRAYNTAL